MSLRVWHLFTSTLVDMRLLLEGLNFLHLYVELFSALSSILLPNLKVSVFSISFSPCELEDAIPWKLCLSGMIFKEWNQSVFSSQYRQPTGFTKYVKVLGIIEGLCDKNVLQALKQNLSPLFLTYYSLKSTARLCKKAKEIFSHRQITFIFHLI